MFDVYQERIPEDCLTRSRQILKISWLLKDLGPLSHLEQSQMINTISCLRPKAPFSHPEKAIRVSYLPHPDFFSVFLNYLMNATSHLLSRYLVPVSRRIVPVGRSGRRAFTMTSSLSKEPRRFRPLRQGVEGTGDGQTLKGVVFDVDGTLW